MVAFAAVLVLSACQPILVRPISIGAPVDEGSQLVGCDQASHKITITQTSHLDPSCVYTRAVQITASNVVFDCRWAHITRDPAVNDRLGIEIVAPTTTSLSNVTVRNCIVENFANNNMRIRRDGFKELQQGSEYENSFSNIRVENSDFYGSNGSGLFVDGFVTGVTLTGLDVARSGGVGVYFEGGSKGTVVENSVIRDNGYRDVTPEGVPINIGGVEFRYRSTGREGLAIDGSRDNVVRNNYIHDNSAGAILLYKNCGEDFVAQPDGWWNRPYGSSGNLIEGNTIANEQNGVWIGSRMSENQYFMDCSDTPIVDAPLRKVFLDPSPDNVVRSNRLLSVKYGVRVEDDGNRVESNTFYSSDHSVLIGTKERTAVLGQPVTNTVVTNNTTSGPSIVPYAWIYGQSGTTSSGNRINGVAATLDPATPPPINPFLFAEAIFLAP